ncbi:hypothetical protein ACJMK2_028934 [Sinanodonta woodiana]|uniref:Coiled-coil domain-containing protein 181 n=1 Tax=Sinanodonta woodiana TaxID=1069815 RepID=A0ABD3X8M2_SINWO
MADDDIDDIEKELESFIEKEEQEEQERKEQAEEDPEELEKGQRETLDTKRKEPKVLDDTSGQSDNEDSEPDDYRITEDQQRALQELENLKKEMDYPDEDPPEYNVKERLKELNQELANDPTPVENNREPKVLFKENLVDLVAPPPEYSDDESKSKSPDNIQPNMENKENSGKKSEKDKSEKSSSNHVLIERSGTFELVSADDVTAQDMGLPTAIGEKAKKNSKNKNQKEPRPPSKPRPATATESSRRNVRSQPSQRRPLSAQPHNGNSSEGYNSPYGLTKEQKQLAKQRAEALEKKKKEDERKKKEEEEEKQKESMEAFQYWLEKKLEQEKKENELKGKDKKADSKEEKGYSIDIEIIGLSEMYRDTVDMEITGLQ